MTDFFETRVENFEPKEEKKKSKAVAKKSHKKIKRKREDSNFIVVESCEESTKAHRPSTKYCILHCKYSHFTDSCKDQRAMLDKHKQKKKKNFTTNGKSNKELNALFEKKFQKFVKNKKRRKTVQNIQDTQISYYKSKKSVSSLVESVERGEILS